MTMPEMTTIEVPFPLWPSGCADQEKCANARACQSEECPHHGRAMEWEIQSVLEVVEQSLQRKQADNA